MAKLHNKGNLKETQYVSKNSEDKKGKRLREIH